MLHFPLNILSPGLLTNPAPPTTAFDHVKWRKVVRVIVQHDKRTWSEKLEHATGSLLGVGTGFGSQSVVVSASDLGGLVG